jgi:uncharacterized peroxidase-related enzyme
MFLQAAPETEANKRLYQGDLDQMGFVMNLSGAWAWRPEVCEAFSALRGLLTNQSTLAPRELAVIVCATASSLGDAYCALAWGKRLAAASDAATAAAVLQARHSDKLSPREQALCVWARKIVKDPNATSADDLQSLRTAGLSDLEIFEATAYAAFRLAFSTINDALGVSPDWQVAEAAPSEVRDAVTFGRAVAAQGA